MSLQEKISEGLKTAMKARDEKRLNTLRMLKSDLTYKEKELGRKLTDDDMIAVMSTAAKRRNEAMDEYRRGGREDLYESERIEYEIIKEFLPQQLSPEELGQLIDRAITEVGASSVNDLGAVMKVLMPAVRGRADGKQVNIAVREKLMTK